MTTQWVRYSHQESTGYAELKCDQILQHDGNPIDGSRETGVTLAASDVTLLAPCEPGKIIALWNNFYAAAEKNGWAIPETPYYFMKSPNSVVGPGDDVRAPVSWQGRVFYEGELGIVIGREACNIEAAEASDFIFGYTCVNDVTAMTLIHEKDEFAQWTRAKSFDSFCPVGPVIAALDSADDLTVRTLVNGRERQNYPVSDMIFKPSQLVSLLSKDMTLMPGDLIACGTSLGAMPMKPGTEIEVIIDSVGSLMNQFEPKPV